VGLSVGPSVVRVGRCKLLSLVHSGSARAEHRQSASLGVRPSSAAKAATCVRRARRPAGAPQRRLSPARLRYGFRASWPTSVRSEHGLVASTFVPMRRTGREGLATAQRAVPAEVSAHGPHHPRPKILAIEAPHIASVLRDRGFAVEAGTFGSVRSVPATTGYWPAESDANLPGHTEKEIVVVDLAARPEVREIDASSFPHPGSEERIWAPVSGQIINPRPLAVRFEQEVMDRIHRHGGIFIVFTSARFSVHYVVGSYSEYRGLQTRSDIVASNWDLLDELSWLSVTADTGEEMYVADNHLARSLGLDGYFSDGHFECVVQPPETLKARWATLAVSKFDLPIAGVIFPDPDQGLKGWTFILPQVKRSAELVADLVERVLPVLAPRLFPDAEGSAWTRRPDYQMSRIAELRGEIIAIQEASRQRVRELEEQIEAERQPYAFLDELLTESGGALVQAVIRTLRLIGFEDVVDVDADAEVAGTNGPRREDIRIMDARMPVLVEVKGITGLPSEEDALQVTKYLRPRMIEWNRTDVHGLAVINHQRNIPALDREHSRVFQEDVLINADEQDFTLLTTWDLYRLARGVVTQRWTRPDIEELFLAAGRMSPVPAHYVPLGTIAHVWKNASAIGVELAGVPLRTGDRIAYELSVDFTEENVSSLEIDNSPVDDAPAGAQAGIRTSLIDQLRKGTKLYLVKSRSPRG